MTKTIEKNKWLGICLIIMVLLIISPKISLAAEWEIDWQRIVNQTAKGDMVSHIVSDNTSVYALGQINLPSISVYGSYALIEKRSISDGSSQWSETILPSNGETFYATAVAVDETGVYVAGTDWHYSSGNIWWRVQKRSLADGSLLWEKYFLSGYSPNSIFAGDGLLFIVGGNIYNARIEKINPTNGDTIWMKDGSGGNNYSGGSVVADNSGVYVGGTVVIGESGGDYKWRIEKRDADSGSVVWTKDYDPTPKSDSVRKIFIQNGNLYVIGHKFQSSSFYDYSYIFQKRNLANGEIVWSFDNDIVGTYFLSGSMLGNYLYMFTGKCSGPFSCNYYFEKRSLGDGSSVTPSTLISSLPSIELNTLVAINATNPGLFVGGFSPGSVTEMTRLLVEKRNIDPQIIAAIAVTPNPVNANQNFSADVSASTGNNITQARFLLDDNNQATAPLAADARWSDSYGWTTNATNWDETNKKLSNQIFATAGAKKVWVEISDAVGSKGYASADLTVFAAACVPGCIDTPTTCDKACGGGKKYCTWQYNDCTTTTGFSLNCNLQACPEQNWKEVAP